MTVRPSRPIARSLGSVPTRPFRVPVARAIRGVAAATIIAGGAILAGCGEGGGDSTSAATGGGGASGDDGRLRVVATSWPLASIARTLAGDAVTVDLPLPADRAASAWRPSVEDVIAMQESDLVVFNGAGLSSWRLTTSLPSGIVVVTSDQSRDQWIEDHDHHGHDDHDDHDHDGDGVPDHEPHEHVHHASVTWLDPAIAQRQARTLADALVRVAPQRRNFVEERFQELGALLEEQAAELRALGQRMRDADVMLIAGESHVYQYLARALGVALETPHVHWSDADADALEQEIVPLARAAGRAIVLAPSAATAGQATVLEAAGARVAVVDAMLFVPDGSATDSSAADAFATGMQANVDAIRAALDSLLDD